MAISDFKEMVENARKLKGYSQRELAKMIGMSQSTYNDTINGKIKKPDSTRQRRNLWAVGMKEDSHDSRENWQTAEEDSAGW